ncbi:protein kinase domain containing protein [Stylonychia lemnae]|uniref:Cyclin-F n=1 Tax=Stylonychia lemnae TaxID=5949 RepID=A0A078AS37_STYLE|nr:protein kinase domain containing protein [Stylonychia lemnae]|eukprot:CDW85295.1 protein kinase domain containing protein [Stylonychia lemnae]
MSFSPPKLDPILQSASQISALHSNQQSDVVMQESSVLAPLQSHPSTQSSNGYQYLKQNVNQKKTFNKKFSFMPLSQNEDGNLMMNANQENIDPNMLSDNKVGSCLQNKQSSLKKAYNADKLGQLPYELQLMITFYLSPKEIVLIIKNLSNQWRKYVKDSKLWQLLDKQRHLTINERLQIVQCIVERRSKGKLYKVFDRVTNETCLLRKIFLDVTNAGQDDGIPTSVLREISHLKTLDHQNIGKIRHAEVKNELAQIVYEYHDNNLKEYVRKNSQLPFQNYQRPKSDRQLNILPVEKVKSIIYQIIQALCYCHRHGIMHRNLKPDNIMISKDEIVKLVDLSLSRIANIPHFPYTPEDPKERERSGREARRLWYRPPELLFRKQMYSFEVDMWAVGCLLAELSLGEALFNGESEIEQLFKIFKLTGSPSQELVEMIRLGNENDIINLPQWDRVYFGNVCFNKDSDQMKQIVQAYIPARESSLMKLFDLKERLGHSGLDLLYRLLEINPSQRISAELALQHQFFDSIRQSQDTKRFDYSIQPCIGNYEGNIPLDHFPHIAKIMHLNEIKLMPNGNLMAKQKHITDNMRSILVDWLVDVSVHFEVMSETLHFAVNYIDRTLSRMVVEKKQLQLVGVSCMKIADVFNERSKEYYRQENATEYAYITADEYKAVEVIAMEKEILNLLNFELYSPTSISFLKLYGQILNLDRRVTILSEYLADLMLLAVNQHQYESSMLAQCYIFISMQAIDIPFSDIDEDRLARFRQLTRGWASLERQQQCVSFIIMSWSEGRHNPHFSRFDAVNNKYEQYMQLINIRALLPPLIQNRAFDQWFNYNQEGFINENANSINLNNYSTLDLNENMEIN